MVQTKTTQIRPSSRALSVACAESRRTKIWNNQEMSYEEFGLRLRTPKRTKETVSEYAQMPKAQRDEAKDAGAFLGGYLKDGLRRADTVSYRSLITLDGDRATGAFLSAYPAASPFASLLYSTHSHTPSHPRVRLVFPLGRNVSPEEYAAISRYLAQELGMDLFDECSFLPNQMMYWPSAPADGEYLFRACEKPWLDPDSFLSLHPGWQDPTRLPASSREPSGKSARGNQVKDPLLKNGIVGAFNRAFFPIGKAMETYLPEVYEPTEAEDRWHLIESKSMPGVEILDGGRFAYSHHAKDPAALQLCNAFDLVRLHRFGNGPDSYSKMCAFATEEPLVRRQLTKDAAEAAEPGGSSADGERPEDSWTGSLCYSARTGKLENTVFNLNLILKNDPDFAGFAFNELAGRVEVCGKLPWDRPEGNRFWRDADTAQLKSRIDSRYLPFSDRNYDVSFAKIADDRRFHPIRAYLDSLPAWDGVPRVERIFIDYLQAEDTEYIRTVTRKTFAAAVARIYVPGIKFDCVPVLDGDQGIGKSTIVKDLVGAEYYSETLSLTDMNDKSGAEKLQGFWAVEIGELAGMKKADIECVKSFLSTADDKYRPSYGRVVESHPRQCIILATVNGERGYLRDITGNRRFWVIKVHQKKQRRTWNFTEDFRAQFWAEAKQIWRSGENLWLEGEMLSEAEKAQRGAMETDERLGMVESYLSKKLPENWNTMNLFERREYLSGQKFGSAANEGTVERTSVSNAEIWCECLGRNAADLKSGDSYAIAALMLQIPGWEKTEKRIRLPLYGQQRIYQKDPSCDKGV